MAESGVPPMGGPSSGVAWALRDVQQAALEAHRALARRCGLGVTDLAALEHLGGAAEPIGPVELGHRLGIRSASATVLVDRLVEAGHVARLQDDADGRRRVLALTEHARASVLAALSPLTEAIDGAAAALTDDQAAATTTFLRQAAAALRDYAAEPTAPR